MPSHAYDDPGFGRDAGFRQPILARIIEPDGNLDSLRVVEEIGISALYRTLLRHLRHHARLVASATRPRVRGASEPGRASLVLLTGRRCPARRHGCSA